MKKSLRFLLLVLLGSGLGVMSCENEDDCRRCTGTVTSTGIIADWTVCDNDGSVIRTNNLTDESETTTSTLPEAVAFFESIGLNCD